MKILNKHAEIKVAVEYEDVNGIIYGALCYVIINSNYEVEDVRFSIIEACDQDGNHIEPELIPQIREQLECLAAMKALEKAEAVDFEKEAERE